MFEIRKRKAIEVLAALSAGPKSVRQVQEAIGGSFSTILKRYKELLKLGLIAEKEVWGEEESRGGYLRLKKWLELTNKGRELVERLKQLGLWEEPTLPWDREKWVVLDLCALGEIRGRTRFMKLLFLQKNELEMIEGPFYKFRPWDYGPFSKKFCEDAEELEHDGLLDIKLLRYKIDEFREGVLYIYSLTSNGRDLAEKLLKNSSPDIKETIESRLKSFNEMPLFDLLRYVYDRYPNYLTRSILEWKEEFES